MIEYEETDLVNIIEEIEIVDTNYSLQKILEHARTQQVLRYEKIYDRI